MAETNFYLAQSVDDDGFQYAFKPLGSDIEPIFNSFNIALERIQQYGDTDFDNECVESHPIYEKAGALLSDVCKRDYKDNFFDERIECLDMDTYEVMICSGQKQATMDAVIGIADYENNHKTNCKLLMVELRLGYKSTEGLEAASLNRKVSHTLELLNPAVCLVSDKAIFVFDDLLCQQAIHWMFSKRYSNVSKRSGW